MTSFRDEERRWKRMREVLSAEANGKQVRPAVSQRTLFGIPSTVEQTLERIVAEDEAARRAARHATRVENPLEPVFDAHSRVLVLGTMPSPASRESGFYYGHPRNRFWPVLAQLAGEPTPDTNSRKRDFCLRHHIALWDVLAECAIDGAADASIADAVPNDLRRITSHAPIEAVFCTGAKAHELYTRFCEADTELPAVKLPSTSPANASCSMDRLLAEYAPILQHVH